MSDKGIGFNRTIFINWLDAAADLRAQTSELPSLRDGIKEVVERDITGVDAIRKSVDVIINIWHKSAEVNSVLHTQALELSSTTSITERIWLHYGLTLLYYPFFRQTTTILGQFARTGEPITRQAVKGRLSAEIGHLGSLNRSAERVVASLVSWGALEHQKKGNVYIPQLKKYKTANIGLQSWLLACALSSRSSDQLPFADLIRLPELFPFQNTINLDALRANPKFFVQRQGMWDMVELR